MLDANILIRAALGKRVTDIVAKYRGRMEFFAPDVAFEDTRDYIPVRCRRRNLPVEPAISYCDWLETIIQVVPAEEYSLFEDAASRRLARRDEDDWPILATALVLGCPIWTEDTDFFGCGVATWTSDRIEIYLQEPVS